MKPFLILLAFLSLGALYSFQDAALNDDFDVTELIKQSEENFRGSSNIAEVKMTIQRPKWTREMTMKSWSVGDRLALIVVQSPARDKGSAFLKVDKEIWNWIPSIEKVVKLPPSMMMQSWMGSDFTNDDLVRSASITDDYDHQVIGKEAIDDRDCYKIELVPKPETAVVWGKIVLWISQKDHLQMKTEFYDEDDYLINVMEASGVKEMDGRIIPTILSVYPVEEEGQKTTIEYLSMDFDAEIDESIFTVQQMKRMR